MLSQQKWGEERDVNGKGKRMEGLACRRKERKEKKEERRKGKKLKEEAC